MRHLSGNESVTCSRHPDAPSVAICADCAEALDAHERPTDPAPETGPPADGVTRATAQTLADWRPDTIVDERKRHEH